MHDVATADDAQQYVGRFARDHGNTIIGFVLKQIERVRYGFVGRQTPAVERQVESFYMPVAEIFERWFFRSESPHT